MMNNIATYGFKIGAWSVLPTELLIRGKDSDGKDKDTRVQAKVMALLKYLAERQGRAVSRTELIEQIWAKTYATDDTLNSTIAKLRRALIVSDEYPVYIETVPKVGYRLVPSVVKLHESDVSDTDQTTADTSNLETVSKQPKTVLKNNAEEVDADSSETLSKNSDGKQFKWPARPFLYTAYLATVALLLIGLFITLYHEPQDKDFLSVRAITPLSTTQQLELFPSISADASKVAFIRVAEDMQSSDIIVKDISTGREFVLNAVPGLYGNPVWAPNAKKLAYFNLTGGGCNLIVQASHGSAAEVVSPCDSRLLNAVKPTLMWSGDGRRLLFPYAQNRSEPTSLAWIDVKTKQREVLTKVDGLSQGDANPNLSPNHEYLAYTRADEKGNDTIHVLHLPSGKITKHHGHSALIQGVRWKNNEQILFISNKTGLPSVWLLDTVKGQFSWLGLGGQNVVHIDYAPLGGMLVLSELHTNANIVKRRGNEQGIQAPLQISRSTIWDHMAKYSPVTGEVAFTRALATGAEVWLIDKNNQQRRLLELPNQFVNEFNWSPDGKHIAFEVVQDTGSVIIIYVVEEKQFYTVNGLSGHSQFNPQWLSDSDTLLYSAEFIDSLNDSLDEQTVSRHIYGWSLSKKLSRLLIENTGKKFHYLEDSNQVIFSEASHAGIWVVDVPDPLTDSSSNKPVNAASRTTPSESYPVAFFEYWDVDNGKFYYTKKSSSPPNTLFVHTPGQASEVLFKSERPFVYFDVSEDTYLTSEFVDYSGDIYGYQLKGK